MPWSWVRPVDGSLLDGRPLLDLGCGDGQALRALTAPGPRTVGVDRSIVALQAARRRRTGPLVAGDALALPFRDAAFRVVLAADLFHHLDDTALDRALREARRVLAPGGSLVAWWYAVAPGPARRTADAPRYARDGDQVGRMLREQGWRTDPLPFEHGLTPAPPTAAVLARP